MGQKNTKKNTKKKHSSQANHASLSTGTLDIAKSGIGYVVMESGDVLVRQHDQLNALHGDTVRVKIIKENIISGRKEGRITEVVHRKQTSFVGTIQMSKHFAFFIPKYEKPIPHFYVPLENLNGAKDGELVMVELVQWGSDEKKPVGRVLEVITNENVHGLAMKRLILESGFALQFSDDAMEEAARLSDAITAEELRKRKDCRKLLTFTIDPHDAKDFDDAISIQFLKNNQIEIGVHIADVSHFVTPNTALDAEAYERSTSVYLPDRVNPMLPEEISNVLCSLRPNEDKYTFSAIFTMNAHAEIMNTWIGKTVTHSDHRFTYEDVQEIIETEKGEYADEILLLNNLAQTLRSKRFESGAINFSSREVRFQLDADGNPLGVVVKESKQSHQLIEEFMLLANKTVAKFVFEKLHQGKPIPFPYRVHDLPDEKKLDPFIAFARKYGYIFHTDTPEKIAASFNKLVLDAKGKPEQQVLEQLGIRTMAKAVYTTQNIGHYGLAFEHYCHFTSPIRRYPDVQVHRIIQSILEGNPLIDKKLEEKCKHTSERERAAMETERAANKYKQVQYMQQFVGDEFEAVITGVSQHGFWAETVAHKCEGMISLVTLNKNDEFLLIESDFALVGKHSGKTYRMGDKVTVQVVQTNLDKRQIDFELVQEAGAIQARPTREKTVKKEKVARNTPKPKRNKL